MSLPLPFLCGLLLLAAHGLLDDGLPADPSLLRILLHAPLIALPALVARFVPRVREPWRSALVPISYGLLLQSGDLASFAQARAGGSHAVELVLLIGPLLASDLLLRWLGSPRPRLGSPRPIGVDARSSARTGPGAVHPRSNRPARHGVSMVLMLVAPLLLLAAATDVVFLDRRLAVFFEHTSLGLTIGALLLVLLLSVLLPLLFCWLLPARDLAGWRGAETVRRAARSLGFPERSLRVLETGYREVNAALVGPLPWPRYLVFSDGLLTLLGSDPLALEGVVAHEVGHARARHPALLLLCVAVLPILWIEPLSRWLSGSEGSPFVYASALLGLPLALYALRALAHRFELEADQFSAEALGSASACVMALQRVGELLPQSHRGRGSLRHPSEQRRIAVLRACETDPAARHRFLIRGLLLRRTLAVLLVASLVLAANAHARTWPLDHARWSLLVGRFASAEQLLATLEATTPAAARDLADLQQQIAAARSLQPEGGPWDVIQEQLAEQARQRGETILAQGQGGTEARAALPFFWWALASAKPSVRTRSLYRYCVAVIEQRDADARELWAHAMRRA